MKIGAVICFLLGALSIVRGVVEAKWASDHAGGVFEHRPMEVVWPLIMGVLFVLAGWQLWRRRSTKRRRNGS